MVFGMSFKNVLGKVLAGNVASGNSNPKNSDGLKGAGSEKRAVKGEKFLFSAIICENVIHS